jgi:hypothetical protein
MFNALGNSLAGRNAPQDYLLSRYGGASAAYSLQRLTTGVDNVVRARESVGNTESDFTAQEVAGGQLREFALQNDADLIRFADGGGTNDRMYFDGVDDYVEVTGMTALSDYFGACTIEAKVLVADAAATIVIACLGASAYRLLTVGGSWAINNLVLSPAVSVTEGLQTISVDFDASGQGTALRIDGVEVWSGTAAAGTPNTSFYIGKRDTGSFWKGLIYDFSLSGSSVKNFAFDGYGVDAADWEDTVGSNDGTVNGSPALFSGQGFDAYVTTLYDQSGNSRDATQATAAAQPQIVADGVVVTDANGNPACLFDGSNDWLLTTTVSAITGNIDHTAFLVMDKQSTVAEFCAGASIGFAVAGTAAASILGQNLSGNAWAGGDDLTSPTGSSIGNLAVRLLSKTHVSGSTTGYMDGSSFGPASNTYDMGVDNKFFAIGAYSAGSPAAINAKISEVVFYLSDESSDRAAIETNVAARHGITLS